jgi:hypothetical protein
MEYSRLAYKPPELNDSQIDNATDEFLAGLSGSFNDTERTFLRNRTLELVNIPQSNVNLTVAVQMLNGQSCEQWHFLRSRSSRLANLAPTRVENSTHSFR